MALPPWPGEEHVCRACGFAYARHDVVAARAAVAGVPTLARRAVRRLPRPAWSVRPAPDVWCAAEYAAHLRDVAVTTTIRLHRVRTEDRPVLEPMRGDLRARRFRYAQLDVEAVLDELAGCVHGLLDEADRVTDWDRAGRRQPGEERTARWLLRHAAHEGLHHVLDLDGLAGGTAPRA